jgi:hypothetical protein
VAEEHLRVAVVAVISAEPVAAEELEGAVKALNGDGAGSPATQAATDPSNP